MKLLFHLRNFIRNCSLFRLKWILMLSRILLGMSHCLLPPMLLPNNHNLIGSSINNLTLCLNNVHPTNLNQWLPQILRITPLIHIRGLVNCVAFKDTRQKDVHHLDMLPINIMVFYPITIITPLQHKHVATQPTIVSPNWLLDSSVSHHISNDLQNLSLHSDYAGPDDIIIGDSKGLEITQLLQVHLIYKLFTQMFGVLPLYQMITLNTMLSFSTTSPNMSGYFYFKINIMFTMFLFDLKL